MMKPSINEIIEILQTRGNTQYGEEAVSQLEHALQCAALAQSNDASPELITACLLHDFGHLIHDWGEDAATRGIDDRHEYCALPFLSLLFSSAITEPIRLHVAAKRYLCAANSQYFLTLSPASQHSLNLQGGILSPEEATKFINHPYANDAVKLRIWDDQAKHLNYPTPSLEDFIPTLQACLKSSNQGE
ncbi:phosphonate degradation HD-domain oxygenase [Limnoraphis robusta]|nr:phosphonate degradation HD-domain oxygenase [Limnoraphis robusta]MEA5499375.1 phosphohydrolase [Limnoraphis robusta BA-68 BA1]